MRTKELKIDKEGMLIINTKQFPNLCAVVLSNGRAKATELAEHAEMTIKTYKGEVVRLNHNESEEY